MMDKVNMKKQKREKSCLDRILTTGCLTVIIGVVVFIAVWAVFLR